MVPAGRMECSSRVADERPVPSGTHVLGAVPLGRRQPAALQRKEVHQDQRDEEVRRGLQEHQQRQRPVQRAAVPPAGQDAEQRAEQERDHRGGAHQDQRPRDRLVQDLGDRRREVRQVGAEVEVKDVAEVRRVLRPERPVLERSADHLRQRLVGLRRQVWVLRQDGLDRVTRYRARDEEVKCDRHPRRYHVEGQAAEDERHAFHLPFCHLVVGQGRGVGPMKQGVPRGNPGRRAGPRHRARPPGGDGGHVAPRHRTRRAAAA